MLTNVSDFVIIPHPNTNVILSSLQDNLIQNVQDAIPVYPLYIPVPFTSVKEDIKKVSILAPLVSDTCIYSPVVITKGEETAETKIIYAQSIDRRIKKDCLNHFNKGQPFNFPINVSVFRLAAITHTEEENCSSWTVNGFRWYKLKKN